MSKVDMLKQYQWQFLLFFFLAGCARIETVFPVSTPTSLPATLPVKVSDAIQHDAEALAVASGISIDEAIRRILMMEASGELNAQLEQNEADTFAGMWLLHQPEFRVVVAFTRDGEAILQPYVEDTILAGLIDVREAAVTQAELIAIEMKANQIVNQLDLSLVAITLVNIQDNQVEIHIPDRSLLEDRLVAAQIELPDHIEIITTQAASMDEPPPNLTPVPGVHFPQLITPTSLVYALSTNGKLELREDCLRLVRSEDDPGALLVWQPGHHLNSNQGVVEVLGYTGKVLARVGEVSCFSPAAGELSPNSGLLRNPLPKGCPDPYFLVGTVDLAFRENQDATLVAVELVDLEVGSFYFIRGIAGLEEWVEQPAVFSGKLVWHETSRCLRLQRLSQASFQDYLVFWPPDFTIQEESGIIEIANGQGEVVARLNEEVRLFGSLVMEVEQIRLPLNDEIPCDCLGGGYWLVIDDQDNE